MLTENSDVRKMYASTDFVLNFFRKLVLNKKGPANTGSWYKQTCVFNLMSTDGLLQDHVY